ncbi:FxsA family protein [Austwickia sp. TVS 96-490-7B]|uniref:FxsA family protein n=1 Tax=Austwickia sp. TVS 96-490-7B TaxID=2830843 RepID=UPI0021037C88|nr:FxsA family protein [Austwickia sp. TVS 96-490-7B]
MTGARPEFSATPGKARRAARRRRPGLSALAVLLLLVMPLLEIGVILAVGRTIGGWPTFLLLLVESLFGAWLMKHEGREAWRAFVMALQSGRMPAKEIADAVLILVGGALLLTPGFITDIIGFLVVAPPTRPLARRFLQAMVERRLLGAGPWNPAPAPGSPHVVTGEVIDNDDAGR